MGWTQNVTVTIGGTDHTSETVDSVFIQRGRQAYWEPVNPGYCSAVLDDPATPPEVGQVVTVDVALNAGGSVRVFTGRVQSVQAQFFPSLGTFVTVQAFGPLARAARRDQNDTLAQQLEGVRIASLLTSGLGEQWAEQPLTQQWQQVDAAKTWGDYGPDPSIIDDGLYLVEPLTDVPTGVTGQVNLAAFSGGGVVYETGDGRVGYADSTRRQGASLGAPLVLDAPDVLAVSALANAALDDLVNQTNLTWSGGTVTYTAADSVAEYGFYVQDVTTILDDSGDAVEFAERYTALQALPAPQLQGPLRVRIDSVADSLADDLLETTVNDYLQVTNVPTSVLAGGEFLGFVEGINFELSDTFANVELFASDERYSIYQTRWADIPDTATWGDVVATLQWQNA